MHQCRVYLPVDLASILQLLAGNEIHLSDGYAVTEWLERAHPAEDEEGLEFLALTSARTAAVVDRDGSDRPLVIAAVDLDSDDVDVVPSASGVAAQVGLRAPVPRRRVVSLHVEEPPAGSRAEPDLLWYDVTELAEVARLAGG
ncbi:MAG: hypothetical protein M3Y71_08205 [Actinomycetota bacterium]|nr:hypothetical protein [Actinomycetota bacterium]